MNEQDLLGYLRDAAQGASNSAASTVSGPVDLLAWLLKKGGVPVGDAPVMGSDWMAQRGFTAQPRNALAGLAGETVGNILPIAAAAKAPQIANALIRGQDAAGRGAVALGQKGADMAGDYMARQGMIQPATVWHGSPHKFDAFDASKIGTGEGAQAYGHGLYLADAPDVAKSYTTAGTSAATKQSHQYTDPLQRAAATVEKAGGDVGYAIQRLAADAERGDTVAAEAIKALKSGAKLPNLGLANLYKVDLPDNAIARMLDWDKPLSQQAPEVQKAAAMFGPNAGDLTGQELYKKAAGFDSMVNVAMKTGGDAARLKTVFPQASDAQIAQAIATAKNAGGNDRIAAQMLRDAGIPGIRYLDGGSRGAGAGTSNYVVFPGEENMLRILERNGVPIGK